MLKKKKLTLIIKSFVVLDHGLIVFYNINSKFKRFNTNLKTTHKLIILLSCYVTYNFKLKIPITNTTTTRKQIQMLPYFWSETLGLLSPLQESFFFFFYFWHPPHRCSYPLCSWTLSQLVLLFSACSSCKSNLHLAFLRIWAPHPHC